MQLAYRHDERPGESYEALDGKKIRFFWSSRLQVPGRVLSPCRLMVWKRWFRPCGVRSLLSISRGCASRGYGRGETRTGAFGSIAAGWGMARSCVGFATASESLRSVSGDGNGLPTWLPMGVSAYRWPVVPRGLNRSSESAEHTCVAFLDARK